MWLGARCPSGSRQNSRSGGREQSLALNVGPLLQRDAARLDLGPIAENLN
jgi:hypothetical protein